ncbi:MAG: aminopeptidase P family N-terminal domain-containing protein [Chloroflexi bacterium]|nr:aminopeptidase P family N-terminal domain-containing protein [Chloroflexota bacterium]
MITASSRLAAIDLPMWPRPEVAPTLPAAIYPARLERLRAKAELHGYDQIVVYADREHSANLAYLTGFDPRFEEAILIAGATGRPVLLAGNECIGLARQAALPVDAVLHQDLSLPSQPRDRSEPLLDVLADAGLRRDGRIGIVGWKVPRDRSSLECPAWLVDAVRDIVGGQGMVENATDLLIDAADGLRVINEAHQLAAFEHASCETSSGVRDLLFGVRPGMREREAVQLLRWSGAPLSCHLMLTAGPRARFGLLSPGDRAIERGDPMTVAFGIWGALTCRAGFVVDGPAELPSGVGDYVGRLVAPYFDAIAEWYGALRIGQTGGALQEIIDRRLGDPFFGIFLNAGHQLHLDEWVNSPISRDNPIELASGMVLQADIIPATGGPYFTTNVEDGVALADERLRATLADEHPDLWNRVTTRRAFMRDALGIELHPDVLPFSNIPAYLPPYLLRPDLAMTRAR